MGLAAVHKQTRDLDKGATRQVMGRNDSIIGKATQAFVNLASDWRCAPESPWELMYYVGQRMFDNLQMRFYAGKCLPVALQGFAGVGDSVRALPMQGTADVFKGVQCDRAVSHARRVLSLGHVLW